MAEKRREVRHPVFLEVKEINGRSQAGSYMLNLSEFGAKLETPLAFTPGESVEICYVPPGEEQETRRRGQIVWAFPAPLKPGSYRLGLQFLFSPGI